MKKSHRVVRAWNNKVLDLIGCPGMKRIKYVGGDTPWLMANESGGWVVVVSDLTPLKLDADVDGAMVTYNQVTDKVFINRFPTQSTCSPVELKVLSTYKLPKKYTTDKVDIVEETEDIDVWGWNALMAQVERDHAYSIFEKDCDFLGEYRNGNHYAKPEYDLFRIYSKNLGGIEIGRFFIKRNDDDDMSESEAGLLGGLIIYPKFRRYGYATDIMKWWTNKNHGLFTHIHTSNPIIMNILSRLNWDIIGTDASAAGVLEVVLGKMPEPLDTKVANEQTT